jgi:small nuclear ribonucleoprotein (snRNP)-like protein
MSVPRFPAPDSCMILTILKAYDSHCNLVLGDVEETIYVIDEDDEDEESVKVARACFPA